VKSSGGSGISMLNGRWMESNDVLEKMPVSRSREVGKNDGSSILNSAPLHSREVFASCSPSEDHGMANCELKVWKEIRFREVLLSQTDPELSLIQV
jgi:hypothetical protein